MAVTSSLTTQNFMAYNLRNIHLLKYRLTGKNIWETTGTNEATLFTRKNREISLSLLKEENNICSKEVDSYRVKFLQCCNLAAMVALVLLY